MDTRKIEDIKILVGFREEVMKDIRKAMEEN